MNLPKKSELDAFIGNIQYTYEEYKGNLWTWGITAPHDSADETTTVVTLCHLKGSIKQVAEYLVTVPSFWINEECKWRRGSVNLIEVIDLVDTNVLQLRQQKVIAITTTQRMLENHVNDLAKMEKELQSPSCDW